jgi:ATP-binding cassette, subfamily C (CFTR/MRP), member 1
VLADASSGSGSIGSRPMGSESSMQVSSTRVPLGANSETKTRGLMTEEVRKQGNVETEAYFALAEAAGNKWLVLLSIMVGFTSAEAIQFLGNWWLTFWSSHGNEYSQFYFLSVYAVISCTYSLVSLFGMLLLSFLGYRASRQLFSNLLAVVLEAPMAFFDTTPIGRLLNRFGKGS